MKSRTKPHNAKVPLVSQIHATQGREQKREEKKVSFFLCSLSFSKKKASPHLPSTPHPGSFPIWRHYRWIPIKWNLPSRAACFPTRMPSDPATTPIPAIPLWQLEQNDEESQRNGYDYHYAIYRVTLMCVAQRRGTAFLCVWQASLLNETGCSLSEYPLFPPAKTQTLKAWRNCLIWDLNVCVG